MAMDIAQVDGTLEFTLGNGLNIRGNKKSNVDLNETPFNLTKEHLSRLRALSKTGESALLARVPLCHGSEDGAAVIPGRQLRPHPLPELHDPHDSFRKRQDSITRTPLKPQ